MDLLLFLHSCFECEDKEDRERGGGGGGGGVLLKEENRGCLFMSGLVGRA